MGRFVQKVLIAVSRSRCAGCEAQPMASLRRACVLKLAMLSSSVPGPA
jgi:hypothetical protein